MAGRFSFTLRGVHGSHFVADGAFLLVVAMTVVNAGNFVFHVVVSRDLGPASYGALGALLGLILVLSVPVAALQVVISREVTSRRGPHISPVLPVAAGSLLAESVLWGTGAALLLAAAAPVLRSFLHLPSTSTALLLSVYVVPIAIGLVPKAVLLGQMRYRLVAAATVAGGATRLVLGIALVRAGAGVDGAVGASVFAAIIEAVILLPGLRSMLQEAPDVEPLRARWKDTSSALVAMVGFWVLSAIGTLLARHYLPNADSGFYAAAWTAATAAMFVPAAVSLVVFPRFVAAAASPSDARSVLAQALGVVGLLAFGAATLAAMASATLIRVLFGPAYVASTAVVGVLAVGAALLAIINLLVYFHLAGQERAAASLSWAGVALAIIGSVLCHSSTLTIAAMFVVAAALVAGLLTWSAFRRDRDSQEPQLAGKELWELHEPDRDVTIVVPFYNPGPRFRANIDRLTSVLSDSGATFEIVAVSDGCTDGSDSVLDGLDPELVRCVGLVRNCGKGQALRVGLAMGRGRYLGFIDADGDLEPSLLLPLLALVKLYQPDIVLGSKRHPMSTVHYPAVRRLYSWGYQQLIRMLFQLKVRDTQTGLKLVRREVVAEALPRMVEKRFAFDLELFVVARRLGWTRFFEAPVVIQQRFSSTISVRTVWPMLLDTLAIFYRLRVLGFYGERSGRGGTDPAAEPGMAGRALAR